MVKVLRAANYVETKRTNRDQNTKKGDVVKEE